MTDTTKQPAGAELLIDYRLSQMERAVTKLVEQNATIIAMEQRHLETREALERAFKAIKDNDAKHQEAIRGVDTRVRNIEVEMQSLRMVRGWVITGVLAVVAASATVVLKSVTAPPLPAAVTQPARTG
ncbi:hypothetical protein LJR296_001450 [Cupriavidus necator]|uniref:hypothetical protein n=1 Tax=Cupriavidus necator TaxID=106590 RepID=UPI003ECDEFC4